MATHSSHIVDYQFSYLNYNFSNKLYSNSSYIAAPQKPKNTNLFILLNARSIKNKTDEIDAMIKTKSPSVLCLTETWVFETDPSLSDLSLVKYKKFAVKRQKAGGGVAILIEQNLPCNFIDSYVSDSFEFICIDIKFTCYITVRCILVYRTPSCSTTNDAKLIDSIERLSTENCIVLGDFNLPEIDWHISQSKTNRGLEFLTLFQNFNYNQLVREPTRKGKILDLVFSNSNLIIRTDVLPGISDHELVEFYTKFPKKNRNKPYTRISTDKLSMNQLDGFMFSQLNSIRTLEFTIDNKYNRMQQILQQGVQNLQTLTFRKPYPVSHKLKKELQYKIRLWKLQKLNPYLHSAYISQVEKVKILIKSENETRFSKIVSKPAQFFKYIRARLKDNQHTPDIELQGEIISNNYRKAEAFATEFQKYFSFHSAQYLNWVPPSWVTSFHQNNFADFNSLTDLQFDVTIVADYLKLLTNKFNTTPDGVHSIFIRNCDIFFSQFACDIFRTSLDTSILPEIWKLACILPIFKRKGKINQINNYRPITLSCTLLKVFETMIYDNILKHFIKHNLFDKSQFGFLPRRSTNLQLIYQLELWHKALYDNENVVTIYVDFAKAFDSVNVNLLLSKLFHYGIRGKILKWLEAYLQNRKFYVKIQDEISTTRNITSGVPQGSPLGPLLFAIFINDLPQIFDNTDCKILMYADDLKLLHIVKNNQDLNLALQISLNSLHLWSQNNHLPINIDKTFIFALRGNPGILNINGKSLQLVSEVKDLGVIIDKELNFKVHIRKMISKAFARAFHILKYIRTKKLDIWARAFKIYIRPILEYCVEIWAPTQRWL